MMTAVEVESRKLPNISSTDGTGIYEGKFIDRSPAMRAAGKLTFVTGESVPQCMTTPARPQTPDTIRRFNNFYRAEYGQERVFYGRANDPHRRWAKEMTHGAKSVGGAHAAELLNPPPRTLFQQRFLDRQEQCYASKKHLLGRTPDTNGKLPNSVDVYNTTFGVKTEKMGSAGELVNPNKRPIEIAKQENKDHDTYLVTHRHFHPGEQLTRAYTTTFNRNQLYGVPTPHRNDGMKTRQTLRWVSDDKAKQHDPLVSKRLDDFRERTQPQLGKVLDPIKETMKVPPDHTYGILYRPDPYGVDDLLHGRAPRFYLRGKDRERGMISAIRHQLKKENFQHFPTMIAAFHAFDKEGTGKLDKDALRRVCHQFGLPIDTELLEQLLDYCDVDQDGMISLEEFANFLNWKDQPMYIGNRVNAPQSAPATVGENGTPARIKNQIDAALERWTTSNGLYNEAVHAVDSRRLRTYGVPTVRSDLPIPRNRRVSDRITYGHEGDARSVLQPSIFAHHGIYEMDMLGNRSKEELKSIFEAIGVHMTGEMLDEVYNTAAAAHPRGMVSVEAFRAVLDSLQANQLKSAIEEKENEQLTAST